MPVPGKSTVEWSLVPYDDPDLQLLVDEVQEEYVRRYGGRDRTPVDPTEFVPPGGAFLLGRREDRPVACGAYRRHDDGVAELKRMYVRAGSRRQGIARALLQELEARARAAGYVRAVLETGLAQPEALALYASAGWTPIPSYGYYKNSPNNRCFVKELA
jgi:GNAT superfamily N-acetyltransferase